VNILGVMLVAYLMLLALMLAGVMAPAAHPGYDTVRERSTLRWARALGMQLLAWGLLSARWTLPLPWLEPLACGLLLAGYSEMARGLAAETSNASRGRALHLPSLATVVILAVAQLRGASIEARLLIFWMCAFVSLTLSLWTLSSLYRIKAHWPERALGLLFVLAVPLITWRLAAQALAPAAGPALQGGISVVQAAVLVYFVLLPVLASAGFLYVRHLRRHERIHYLATHDPLTGLYNRESFLTDARHALRENARRGGVVSVLMLDIDHFKQINDRHGHAAGDDALREVAAALRGAVRSTDMPTRFGGDEFAVLLPGAAPERALAIAQGIVARLAGIARVAPGRGAFTVSIGLASTQTADESLDALLHRADLSLYQAKQSGRDRIVPAPDGGGEPACA
jgi:diguanylate cyclase (GGDEF)-like protein